MSTFGSSLLTPDLPFALQVELTSHCNLHCKMCPLYDSSTLSSLVPGHMSETHLDEVIALAAVVKQVIVAGFGESLLNPYCLPFLRKLDELNVQMSFSTNGMPITPKVARQLAVLRNLIHLNISIDSPDPEIYKQIRGGQLNKALRGLENLMAVIPSPEIVTVSSVLMRENMASLVHFPAVLQELGVKKFVLQAMIDYVPDLEQENMMYAADAANHINRIQEAANKTGIELILTIPERLQLELTDPEQAKQLYFSELEDHAGATRRCCLSWEIPFIDKDGRVYACCYAASSGESLGSLSSNSANAFLEVWHGEAYQQFREGLLDGYSLPEVCQRCTIAAVGVHPLRRFTATVLTNESMLCHVTRMRLVVQNTGALTWTRETKVRIGTANPRDRDSAYYHRSWISPNRVATFVEDIVLPGAKATFEFQITPVIRPLPETFQLVVDGEAWLPNTCFIVLQGQFSSPYWRLRRLTLLYKERIGFTVYSLIAFARGWARRFVRHRESPRKGRLM